MVTWVRQVAARDPSSGEAANVWTHLESQGSQKLALSATARGLGAHVRLAQLLPSSDVAENSCSLSPALQRQAFSLGLR